MKPMVKRGWDFWVVFMSPFPDAYLEGDSFHVLQEDTLARWKG